MTQPLAALRAVTLNNAGIYYARTGNPAAALRCLERVGSQGGAVVEDDVSVHVTLNMTTVLADLGRHGEALEKAQEDGLVRRSPDGVWQPTALGFRFLNDLQARFLP